MHPPAISLDKLLTQCVIAYTRSSGPGGQHVNKTDSAVVLLHKPTGVRLKVNEFRSQYQNKQRALERLQKLLQQRYLAAQQRKAAERFKNKPQKRPRRVKEAILKEKKLISRKKNLRKFSYSE